MSLSTGVRIAILLNYRTILNKFFQWTWMNNCRKKLFSIGMIRSRKDINSIFKILLKTGLFRRIMSWTVLNARKNVFSEGLLISINFQNIWCLKSPISRTIKDRPLKCILISIIWKISICLRSISPIRKSTKKIASKPKVRMKIYWTSCDKWDFRITGVKEL